MADPRARRVALNVSGAALLLALAKGGVGFAAGSIAILSSALDSAGDMLASFANFVFLRLAAKPPDEGHPFGHGKAEHLASMLQGVILLSGAVTLAYRAADRIRHPVQIESGTIAIVVMVGSMIATFFVTRYMKRNAVQTESTALAADSMHYTSDFVANGATILALILVRYTGNPLFDSIFGVSVAFWIAWNSFYLMWRAGNDLMDSALPDEDIAAVIGAIEKTDPAIAGYRDLRTRRASGVRFIEFELCIERNVSFDRAHDASEAVKEKIRERFPRTIITIHAEPVDAGQPPTRP